MRPIDADRALEIVRDQAIAHPNAYHLTNYATLILQEAPTLTDLSKCLAFNSTADDKPQTNADRIRAMSDKELAFWLAEWYVKEAVLSLQYKGVTPSATEIKAVTERLCYTLARWLQQPVEE